VKLDAVFICRLYIAVKFLMLKVSSFVHPFHVNVNVNVNVQFCQVVGSKHVLSLAFLICFIWIDICNRIASHLNGCVLWLSIIPTC